MSSSVFRSTLEDGVLRGTVTVARLDAAAARHFKSELEAAWQPDLKRVELDMGEVEFVDSSGVGALISGFRKLGGVPGSMLIRHARPGVRSVLELLRLDGLLEPKA
jgi:anti-sigma B factor antagonist